MQDTRYKMLDTGYWILDVLMKKCIIEKQASRIKNQASSIESCIVHRASCIVNDTRGLTLIEVVAILIIIGVLTAVATISFTGTSTIYLRGAAEMIQADIRYAQAAAMTKNILKSINFVPGATSYTVDSEVRELPSRVIITAGGLFTFDSLGEPTAGGGQSVSLSDGTNTNTITVVNYTGKVSIN